MITPNVKRNISRIIPFGLLWLVFGGIYTLLEKGILGDLEYYPSTGNPYNFEDLTVVTLLMITITGLAVGTFEVLYLSKRFRQKSLRQKIVYKTAIYLLIIVIFLIVTATISNSIELQTSLFDTQVLNNVWQFMSNMAFWSIVLYIGALICISLFYTEVSMNIGHEVLNNFLTGKYHRPIQENRIFMFLDMKSSTTIAEKLGHVRYFEMLSDYYSDLSVPIIQYHGEIYQYVGDEIIISWKLHNGLLQNNCIRCFYAMKKVLLQNSEEYQDKFGLTPSFKAGFHYGSVTTGEIGVIKKDIIFTGDVLNTTARIQSLCNELQVELLISGDLISKLNLAAEFRSESFGEKVLRGRDEKIEVFTLHSTNTVTAS